MTDIEAIADRTAAGIALAYRSGEADPLAVTECLLARIGKAKAVFITVTGERALVEAKASAARYRDGKAVSPLDGVPVAWKDLIDVAGAPTTAGSKLYAESAAKTADAAVVANASAAGMVTLGKLNLTEFAYSGLGLNPHFGTPHNPNDSNVPRAPGGSSAGSGVAVAARLVPCAAGTDTGGSVRIPASFNGVVGYKPSTGRLPGAGVFPLASTYDVVGPLARSVEDCVLFDMAARSAVTTPVRRANLQTLTLVVPENIVFDGAEQAVIANFERTIQILAKSGVTIRRERIPAFDEAMDLGRRRGTITAAEAYYEHRELVESEKVSLVDRRVVRRIMDGKKMSADDLISIQRGRLVLMAELAVQLAGARLVMPTTPITAPEIAPLEADDEVFHKVNLMALRNTAIGNMLDLCGVALPNGKNPGGMPTSFLISACHGEDDALLGEALAIERAIGGSSTG